MNPQYNSRTCFACGLENPAGLHLRFYDNGKDQVFANCTLEPQHASYPGMAHGGIVAAILDEVGWRTVMIGNPNRFFVPARMDLPFRHPVPWVCRYTNSARNVCLTCISTTVPVNAPWQPWHRPLAKK